MRPLVELTGFDSEARVKGAPISLSDDIVRVRRVVCSARSARVAAVVASATFEMFFAGTLKRSSGGTAVA